MNLFALSGLLGMIASILMAILMFTKGKSRTQHLWGVFCISVAFWGIGVFRIASTEDATIALFWWKIASSGTILIPLIFNHFVYEFLKIKNNVLIYITYLIAFVFLGILFTETKYLVVLKWSFNEFFYNSSPSIVYKLFTVYFFSLIGWSHYKLWVALRTAKEIQKMQIKYFFIGTIVGFSGGGFNFLPVYGINLYPFLNFTIFLYPIIVGYSIIKYRLMDIRIVMRNFFVYLNIIVFSSALFIFFIWLYKSFVENVYELNIYAITVIATLFLTVIIILMDKTFKKIANKFFFLSLYNYQETINKLSEKLNYYTDLNKVINSIVDTIKQTMQLDRAGVLLINQNTRPITYNIARIEGFNEQNGISLVKSNFLTRYLQKNQKLLVRDELMFLSKNSETKTEEKNFKILYDHMKHIEASLCLPLISSNKLIGIIVLGSKISNDAYTKEDLDLLDTLSNQAGIAVENAKLYEEITKFNKTLKHKVHEQTKDIKEKAFELEEKNKSLEELLNMKSDFLRVVHHQLNTPISIMKNSLFMIKDKSFTKDKGLKFIEAGLKRVDETINDFWSAFALEGSKIKMDPENVDIKKLISGLLEEKKQLEVTKKRKLELKLKNPNKKVPLVFCDPKQITQSLSNLLDNAIHYTLSGYIEISFEEEQGSLKIRVTDSGSGISEEDQEKLFQKFSRGSRATQFYANGSGLGLYIAKKIIEGNEGKLELEKTQVDKGTTFTITLPIFTNQIPIVIEKTVKQKTKGKTKKKTILFIEDEKDFSDIYKNYFNKKGYVFEVTDDTKEVSKMIEKIKPDLILLDIILPQKKADGSITNIVAEQGWEFLKKAKKETNLLNIPIIIFTNLNSSKDRQKAKRLQARDYILKSEVTPKKLEEMLKKY